MSHVAGPHLKTVRLVLLVAVADWAVAFTMTVAGAQRQLSVPLLVVAVGAIAGIQAPRLMHVAGAVRSAPQRGLSRWAAAETALGDAWSPRVARLVVREPRLMWSLVLLVRHRRDGERFQTFSGYRDALPVWVALGGVAVVEVALTALLPLPRLLDTVLLVLGVWGLVVVAGLTAALVVHPHVLEPERVRLRCGFWDEVVLPRTLVGSVRVETASVPSRGLSVGEGRASLAPSGSTNLVLDLLRPEKVRGQEVKRVAFNAHDPRSFATALRSQPGEG